MTPSPIVGRAVAAVAGLVGATGVILAALAAHQPNATQLGAASSMLLFHAAASLGALALGERRILQPRLGLIAAAGFVTGAPLFAADLVLRQFAGHSLFPMAAPTGGALMIASWMTVTVAALRAYKSDR